MNAKQTIRKIIFITIWLCIGGGMLTLLLAAINNKKNGQCSSFSIVIKGANDNFFIDKKDIEQLLIKASNGSIVGQPVVSFKLHELEKLLLQNVWINNAELYFDSKDILHIIITEREPIARIFTTEGNSFYLDSLCNILPLSDKTTVRVPAFTGFPEKKVLSSKDSLLLNEVRLTATYIKNHPFWMAQVSQVNITPERTFEMIPEVGNHLVKLGNGENIDSKFKRLMVFYNQVLSKTGFNKYRIIDVEYTGQVVVTNNVTNNIIDSVLLRRNVEKLLQQSRDTQNDTIQKVLPVTGQYKIENDAVETAETDLPVRKPNIPEQDNNPNPRLNDPTPPISARDGGGQAVKQSLPVNDSKKKLKENIESETKPIQKEIRKPKAIMPKKQVTEENTGNN